MIRSSSISDDYTILILLQFPFRDPTTCATLLSKRWSPYLDSLLQSLPFYNRAVDGSPNIDKAQEILRLIDPNPLSSPVWNRQWSPPSLKHNLAAERIADNMNAEISAQFKFVPFTTLVRIACGYSPNIRQDLFDRISNIHAQLCNFFEQQHPLRDVFQQAIAPYIMVIFANRSSGVRLLNSSGIQYRFYQPFPPQ